ncbi:MAG: HlyD family efflux transporter periplasmic adaptor subunit [Bryobacterales bacterium]|nr:HlyD family efflux transporter periplasmic adaptor subunit [Bryobacterales bacterium]
MYLILGAVVVLAIGLVYWLGPSVVPTRQAAPGLGAVPLYTVTPGEVRLTIRLTGTTTPERYALLTAPILRGGRGGALGMGGGISTGAGRGGRSGAGGGGGESPSTTASTAILASAGGGASGGAMVASTAGTGSSTLGSGGSGSAAFRAATTRFGATSPSARTTRSSAGSSSGSSAMGSGLGSTAASLPGGPSGPPSGGGGGGGSVMVVSAGPGGARVGFGLTLVSTAKPGSWVKKGDIVAEFDREDMLNRLDDFKARVTQAEATIKSIRAQLEVLKDAHDHSIRVAKANLDKALLDLKTTPVRSANASEILRLNAEEAEAIHKQLLSEVKFMEQSLNAQLRIAELARDEAKVELQRVQANVDRMVVRAPIDGMVVMQTVIRGGEQAQIQAGDQVGPGQPYMRIVDPSSMLVEAAVNQVDAERIRVGARATVRFDAYPDLELPARVVAIGAMPKAAGWRLEYVKEIPVTLKLERLDARVIPDLSVSADVEISQEQAAAVVPLEGIFRDGPGRAPYVFVRRGSSWETRPVELGLVNHITAAVRSGLKPGEVIALRRPPAASK